jgi:hypothetical protein
MIKADKLLAMIERGGDGETCEAAPARWRGGLKPAIGSSLA